MYVDVCVCIYVSVCIYTPPCFLPPLPNTYTHSLSSSPSSHKPHTISKQHQRKTDLKFAVRDWTYRAIDAYARAGGPQVTGIAMSPFAAEKLGEEEVG